MTSEVDTTVCHQTASEVDTSGEKNGVGRGGATEGGTDVSTSGVASDNVAQEDRVLCERDVGITEYISSLPGFSGIIKQRCVIESSHNDVTN